MTAARWAAGEKLSESSASDVRQLCTTLLNCYLIQARTLLRLSCQWAISWPHTCETLHLHVLDLVLHC